MRSSQIAAALWLVACGSGDGGDSGVDIGALCAGEGASSVALGTGAGEEFIPFADGDVVGMVSAPQGGFGVDVRASTTGLVADDAVRVLLETVIDGEVNGSFLNESVQLYCQDDGSGLLWGVVVGFDSSKYKTNDDLLELDGQVVDLVVTVTDVDGNSESGVSTVEIAVGN